MVGGFWMEVSRGGVEYEDNHPTTVLDTFLKPRGMRKHRTVVVAKK